MFLLALNCTHNAVRIWFNKDNKKQGEGNKTVHVTVSSLPGRDEHLNQVSILKAWVILQYDQGQLTAVTGLAEFVCECSSGTAAATLSSHLRFKQSPNWNRLNMLPQNNPKHVFQLSSACLSVNRRVFVAIQQIKISFKCTEVQNAEAQHSNPQ